MTLDCTCNRLIEAQEKADKWDAITRCADCRFSLVEYFPRTGAGRYGREMFLICAISSYKEQWFTTSGSDFCSWGRGREE